MSARGVLGNAYLVFAPKETQSSACAAGKILGVSGVWRVANLGGLRLAALPHKIWAASSHTCNICGLWLARRNGCPAQTPASAVESRAGGARRGKPVRQAPTQETHTKLSRRQCIYLRKAYLAGGRFGVSYLRALGVLHRRRGGEFRLWRRGWPPLS